MQNKYNSTTQMEISSGSRVSWLNAKDKILHSIKERQPSLYINALKVLDQIEREYNLSGTNQSTELSYYNNVSGIFHAIDRTINPFSNSSTEIDRWPDSSMFVLKIQNKIVLVGLGGVIEYDEKDIKQYSNANNNNCYVNNAKVTFFNGSKLPQATLHSKNGEANASFFLNPSFNNDDLEILPSLGESYGDNSYSEFKNNLSYDFTAINYKENGENKTSRYGSEYTIKFPKGSSKLDLSLMNGLNEAEIYRREKENGKYKLTKIYTGTTRNLVPDGNGTIYRPSINGHEYNSNVIANGTNINSFVGMANEQTEAKILEDYSALITNLNYDNQQKADKIDNFSKFLSLLRADFKPIVNPFIIDNYGDKIFGITYKEQIEVNENGRFCFILSNESTDTANSAQEVIFDDGSIFIGKCIKGNEGQVKFITGTFFKNGKKKTITDLTMEQLLNTTIDKNSEKITDKDLELFKNTNRLKIVKEGNNYKTVFISKDLTASIEEGILNQDYTPSQEYLDSLLVASKDFCISMLYQLSSGDNEFKVFAEEIKNNHFSEELKEQIVQHIINLYNSAKNNSFERKNNTNNKFTFADITNLYHGIENLSYLVNIYEAKYNKPPYIKNSQELNQELNESRNKNNLLQSKLDKEREQSQSVIDNLNKKVNELTDSQLKLQQQANSIAKPQNDNNQQLGNSSKNSDSNFNIINSTNNNNSLKQSVFNSVMFAAPVTIDELKKNTKDLYKALPETEGNPDITKPLNTMYYAITDCHERLLDTLITQLSNIKQKEPLSQQDVDNIADLVFNPISEKYRILPNISPNIDAKFAALQKLYDGLKIDPSLKQNKISKKELDSMITDLSYIQENMAAKNDNATDELNDSIEQEQIRQSQILETNNVAEVNYNNMPKEEPIDVTTIKQQSQPVYQPVENTLSRQHPQSFQERLALRRLKNQPTFAVNNAGNLYASVANNTENINNDSSTLHLSQIPLYETVVPDNK